MADDEDSGPKISLKDFKPEAVRLPPPPPPPPLDLCAQQISAFERSGTALRVRALFARG